jgi:hypothetical protein
VLVPHAEEILGDVRTGLGNNDRLQKITLRCILETFYEFNLDLHLLFVDFKQACSSINRIYLYEILKEYVIPK